MSIIFNIFLRFLPLRINDSIYRKKDYNYSYPTNIDIVVGVIFSGTLIKKIIVGINIDEIVKISSIIFFFCSPRI